MRACVILLLALLCSALGAEDPERGSFPAPTSREFVHESFTFMPPEGFSPSVRANVSAAPACFFEKRGYQANSEMFVYVEASISQIPASVDDPNVEVSLPASMDRGQRRIADWAGTKVLVVEGTTSRLGSGGTRVPEFIAIAFIPTRPTSVRLCVRGPMIEVLPLRELMASALAGLKPPAGAAPGQAVAEQSNTLVYAGISLAVTLLIVGGLAFIFTRKPKPAPMPHAPMPPAQVPHQTAPNPSRPPWEQ